MKIERIKHLITNLLTGSSSTSERAELAKWMNSEDAERNSREAWKSASEDIDESLKSEIWNNIQLKIKGAVSSKPVSPKHSIKRQYLLHSKSCCRYCNYSMLNIYCILTIQ